MLLETLAFAEFLLEQIPQFQQDWEARRQALVALRRRTGGGTELSAGTVERIASGELLDAVAADLVARAHSQLHEGGAGEDRAPAHGVVGEPRV